MAYKNEFESKIIVNTLPHNLFLNTIQVLPELTSEYANNLSLTHTWMGESIKAGITLMNNQWRRNDLGSFFSQFGPITELHDHIHDNNQGSSMLMGFIDPVFHDLTPEARYQKVKEQLTLYFDPVDNTMVDYAELDWQNEEYSFFPYQSDVIPHQNNGSQILREPLFNSTLLMAGTETAKSFPGYMDGAVERANEIMSYLMKKIK